MTEHSNIDDYLKNIERKIIAHNGSGEESHSAVTRTSAGFSLPQHMTRIFLKEGTDVDELEDGFFYGYKLASVPESEKNYICLIDVKTSGEGRRDLILKNSSNGNAWSKTVHTKSVGGSGWVMVSGFKYKLDDPSFKTPSGASGRLIINAAAIGGGGTIVNLSLTLTNVDKLKEGSSEIIFDFKGLNINPKNNFLVETYDWNIPIDGDRRYGRILVTSDKISFARSKNCTNMTSFRFNTTWIV